METASAECAATGRVDLAQADYAVGMRVVAGIILSVAGVTYASSISWWLWRRRSSQMIFRRSTFFMLVSALGGALNLGSILSQTIMGRAAFPCEAALVRTTLGLFMLLGPILTRLVLFYNSATLNARLLQLGAKALPATSAPHAFRNYVRTRVLRRRSRTDSGTETDAALQATYFTTTNEYGMFIYSLMLGVGLVVLALILTDAHLTNPYLKGCTGCVDNGSDGEGGVVLGLLVLAYTLAFALCLWVLWSVRKEPDSLGILRELKLAIVCVAVIIFGAQMAFRDPGGLQASGQFDWLAINACAILALHVIQCPLQLVRSSRHLHRAHADSDPGHTAQREPKRGRVRVSLQDVLADKTGKERFTKHLAAEFSVESMLFHDNVRAFQARAADPNCDARVCIDEACKIYSTYVSDNAQLQINIAHGTRRKVEQQLAVLSGGKLRAKRSAATLVATASAHVSSRSNKSVAPAPAVDKVFDGALHEVLVMLSNDSFPRFQCSRLFEEWLSVTLV